MSRLLKFMQGEFIAILLLCNAVTGAEKAGPSAAR